MPVTPMNEVLAVLKTEVEKLKITVERQQEQQDDFSTLLTRLEERLQSLISILKWLLASITAIGTGTLIAVITQIFRH